ncbi:hypothetical protein ACPUYX_11220 [Desulfosporosinus sp. SYSU MS00001]|uniref:hypothetical protein n=1 Tax=Desulfosporosinus sp. SYSU MS00001 TaxID=3416284 RepID=UPI003CF5018A
MTVIILFVVSMLLNYYIYTDPQKRGVTKEYKRVLFNLFITFVGALIYLWKRPKKMLTTAYQKRPCGFRTKHKGRMAIASIAYIFLFATTVLATTTSPTDTSKTSVPVISTASNTKVTETKSSDLSKQLQPARTINPI